MSESDAIPFVSPPPKWAKSKMVERLPGTRWYVEHGSRRALRHWVHELREHFKGELLPLQWVPEYVGVTRAAVRKRAKAGGLTVFTFILTQDSKNILGKVKERETRKHYEYAALRECDSWRDDLLDRTSMDLERRK